MEQTVMQIGNSTGVVIPKPMGKRLGLRKGSRVVLEVAPDQRTLLVSKAGVHRKVSSVTPEFVEILKGVNRRYGTALAKLAQLQ